MQKITLFLFLNFVLAAFAVADLKQPAVTDEPEVIQPEVDTPGSQKRITELLQEDILFEHERRQLSNAVALEKLRAELRKIRTDSTPVSVATESGGAIPSPTPASRTPEVLAVSQVAGITKIAVSTGQRILLVGRFETFDVDGKKYRLQADSKNKLTARAVTP